MQEKILFATTPRLNHVIYEGSSYYYVSSRCMTIGGPATAYFHKNLEWHDAVEDSADMPEKLSDWGGYCSTKKEGMRLLQDAIKFGPPEQITRDVFYSLTSELLPCAGAKILSTLNLTQPPLWRVVVTIYAEATYICLYVWKDKTFHFSSGTDQRIRNQGGFRRKEDLLFSPTDMGLFASKEEADQFIKTFQKDRVPYPSLSKAKAITKTEREQFEEYVEKGTIFAIKLLKNQRREYF